MDQIPFETVKSSCDVLFLYNYSDFNLDFDFSKYSCINLLAYSYGVFMSSFYKDKLPNINHATALNGTLIPIDNTWGIPQKIFALTLENMTLDTALKFRKKLFNNDQDFQKFNKNLPNRPLDNSIAELEFIKQCAKNKPNMTLDFDKIIISTQDKIFPTKSQRAFWADLTKHQNIKEIESGHFPFYQFESFQDIINL